MARHIGASLMTIGGSLFGFGVVLIQMGPTPTLWGLGLAWWAVWAGLAVTVAGAAFFVLGHPRPHLALNGSEAFHVERVSFGFPADVLCMRIINQRRRWIKSTTAKAVSATFRVEGPGAEHLLSLNARWSDTVQPPKLQDNEVPQLAVELNVNSGRQINLVIKEPDSDDCYLFNNDSYHFPRGQHPAWRMAPGEYRAVVDVSGDDGVEAHFECFFVNHGLSGIEVLSFGEM